MTRCCSNRFCLRDRNCRSYVNAVSYVESWKESVLEALADIYENNFTERKHYDYWLFCLTEFQKTVHYKQTLEKEMNL